MKPIDNIHPVGALRAGLRNLARLRPELHWLEGELTLHRFYHYLYDCFLLLTQRRTLPSVGRDINSVSNVPFQYKVGIVYQQTQPDFIIILHEMYSYNYKINN